MKKKVGIIIGTRPDILKMSPIIKHFSENSIPYTLIHSGQHYDPPMDTIFFEDLSIPKPHINLQSSLEFDSFSDQTAVIMNKLKKVFLEEMIDIVVVLGDTNTAIAASIIARRMSLVLVHIEAGLRSFDWKLQEEHNRVMIDHISDIKCAPTQNSFSNLVKENIPKNTIYLTGNTIVDTIYDAHPLSLKSKILEKLNLKQRFILATAHRAENVDNYHSLYSIIKGLEKVASELNYKVVFPAHPRTAKKIAEFNIRMSKQIIVIDPPGYLDFMALENSASLIITDSGGVQEEACILKRPCVTIRDYTERPETLNIGCNVLAGVNPDNIVKCAKKMLSQKILYKNPFGDGKSSVYITTVLKKLAE